MRVWAAVTVFVVALSGCADTGSTGRGEGADAAPLGNVALFCRVWPDARQKLLDTVTGEVSFEYEQDEIAVSRFLGDIDPAVPAEVRDEWNRAYATYTTITDLAFITGYSEGMIRAAHLKMAFGDTGTAAAVADTEAAIAAIDDWAVAECGDFCSRWADLARVLRVEEDAIWRDLSRTVDPDEALIAAGDRLVPQEIAAPWNTVTQLQAGFFALARTVEFDQENIPAGEAWTSLVNEYLGTWFDEAHQTMDMAKGAISNWVDANCDAPAIGSGDSGGPGSLALWIAPQESMDNRIILVALLPLGSDFATFRSPSDLVAGRCTENGSSSEWEQMLAEAAAPAAESGIDPEDFLKQEFAEHFSRPLVQVDDGLEIDYSTNDICGFMGFLGRHEAALIPGGTYELFVGTYTGNPGSYGIYSAAPEHCIQFPVTVSGDTVVDLPDLEPCTLGPVGRAEEIERRTPPPFEPGGTLQIEIGNPMQPEGYDHCNLDAVLVPAGTTLNDIGRGDVWPSGMFNLWRFNARMVEGGDVNRWSQASGLVPILAMPPTGSRSAGLSAELHEDSPWDTAFPDPIPLEAGVYDLRIQEQCENEDMQDDSEMHRRCAFIEVEVSGITITKMPELEVCP